MYFDKIRALRVLCSFFKIRLTEIKVLIENLLVMYLVFLCLKNFNKRCLQILCISYTKHLPYRLTLYLMQFLLILFQNGEVFKILSFEFKLSYKKQKFNCLISR